MISVVIPCKNSSRWLPETLTSLKGQEYLTEVIVVDDHSTDNSIIAARSFTSLPISVISSPGQGVSIARNIGLKQASGEWIQFLDADDLLMPNKLKRQYEIGIAYGVDVVYGSWQEYWEKENQCFHPQKVYSPDYSGDCAAQLMSENSFCQIGAMLFRRQAVIDIDGFLPDILCVEDVNFYLRLAFNNAQFFKDDIEVSLLYRKHMTTKSLGNLKLQDFLAGCLKNATLAESNWSKDGKPLTKERHKVLIESYSCLARSYFEYDRSKFHEVLQRLHQLDPHYLPAGPQSLRFLSKYIGYEQAESISLAYRRLKSQVRKLTISAN